MILNQIRQRAAADIQHIILPEGEDIRIVEAAAICVRDGVAKVTVLGNDERVRTLTAEAGLSMNGVE
ncbi:MAG: phosphate acyltransferase, partial [Pyrinomonadaceae bacterium]